MDSNKVQRHRETQYQGGIGRRRREPGMAGLGSVGREFRWDLRGPPPLRAEEGDRGSTRESRVAPRDRNQRQPEAAAPGRAELALYSCARALIISLLQSAAR